MLTRKRPTTTSRYQLKYVNEKKEINVETEAQSIP